MTELKTPYRIVEHSWEETSIYNANGNRVCLFNINDFGNVTEENQDELEDAMGKEIDAIVHALNNYKETAR